MDTAFELLTMKLVEQAKEKRIPVLGAFELTSRCNLNCKMCYVHTPERDNDCMGSELTSDQWIRLASEAFDEGMLFLILTGGEIFVRKDFNIIYENIAHMGFNTTLYTNATLVTRETARWLGKIPPSEVMVTIYGASAETYGRVCGNAEGYRRAVQGIDLMLDQGINVSLRTTVIKDNVDDYGALAEFAFKRGIDLSVVNYISPQRTSCTVLPESRLSPEELDEFEKRSLRIGTDLMKDTKADFTGEILQCRSKLLEELKNIYSNKPADNTGAFGCTAGKCDLWVSWDGKMVPCGLLEEPYVYPLETGLRNAWKKMRELTEAIPSCSACSTCSDKDYCLSCPARLKLETGYFDKPAKYLCDLAKLEKNSSIGINV